MKQLGIGDVILRLERACAAAGTSKAWAQKHGVSEQYVCDVRLRRREPGPSILEALGLRAVTFYFEADVVEPAPRRLRAVK